MHPGLHAAITHEGLLMRSDVLALGLTDEEIRAAVRSGELHRLRPGTTVLAEVWDGLDAVARHVLLSRGVVRKAGVPVVLSHVSALAVHGVPLWDLPLDVVHLTRRDGRGGRREAGVVQHCGGVEDADVELKSELEVTRPARAGLELATMVDAEHALVVFDALLHAGLTTPQELRQLRTRMARWPGTLAHHVLMELADGRRESVGESRTFYLMWTNGVPYAEPQVEVYVDGAVFARLDFAWPERGVWLEFDGRQKYLKYLRPGETVIDAVLREKKREERIASLTGWRCVRLGWADLANPRATAAHINGVLAGGRVHV